MISLPMSHRRWQLAVLPTPLPIVLNSSGTSDIGVPCATRQLEYLGFCQRGKWISLVQVVRRTSSWHMLFRVFNGRKHRVFILSDIYRIVECWCAQYSRQYSRLHEAYHL
jgi:hypothetical protein